VTTPRPAPAASRGMVPAPQAVPAQTAPAGARTRAPAPSGPPAAPVEWTPRVRYGGHDVPVPARYREAGGDLLVLLHGLGCSKGSFDGAFTVGSLRGYSLLTLDFPGHGACGQGVVPGYLCKLESCSGIAALVIKQLAEQRGQRHARVHVAGHSMGGAVAVILAAERELVTGCTVSIDGNLVSADCGLSSLGIARQSRAGFAADGYGRFTARLRASEQPDLTAWAAWLAEADPSAVHTAAVSLVDWSDSGDLLTRFNTLPARAYIHGDREDKRHLRGALKGAAVSVIPRAGHFPMLDAPGAFYRALAGLLAPGDLASAAARPAGDAS
jgi:pimeloyl-ACP methyl ester carboxylesterase